MIWKKVMERRGIIFSVMMLLLVFPISLLGQDQPKDIEPKDTSSIRIVPFKNGYCSVEGPYLIVLKAGASFSFGSSIKYKGKEFQVMIPKTENSYEVSPIDVQLLTKKKEPSGDVKKLKCIGQKWNESLNTVDLTYSDNTIQVIMHIYTPAMGGFIIKDVECKVFGRKK